MLVCARLRHVAGTQWGNQKVHKYEALRDGSGRRIYCRLTSLEQSLQTNLRITFDTTLYFTIAQIFQVGKVLSVFLMF